MRVYGMEAVMLQRDTGKVGSGGLRITVKQSISLLLGSSS